MDSQLLRLIVSIVGSFFGLAVIVIDANLPSQIAGGFAVFCGGWGCCYHSGRWLKFIKT